MKRSCRSSIIGSSRRNEQISEEVISKDPECLCIRDLCLRAIKTIFFEFQMGDLNLASRKKLVATANRREGVYNRAGEPSVTFCGKEEQRRERALIFVKNRSKRYKACSDVRKSDQTVYKWG